MTAFDYTHYACDGEDCLEGEELSGAYADPPKGWTTEYVGTKELHFCEDCTATRRSPSETTAP